MITKIIVKDYVFKKCPYLVSLELEDKTMVELLKNSLNAQRRYVELVENEEDDDSRGPNDEFDLNEALREYPHLRKQVFAEEELIEKNDVEKLIEQYNDFQLISKLSRRYYELMYGEENCRICDVDENGETILDQRKIVRLTKKYLLDKSVKVIFEGQLEIDNLRARFDVLIRNDDDSFDLIEVKGTNTVFEHPKRQGETDRSVDKGIKQKYLYDLLFQYYVYKNAGLDVREIGYMFTNRNFEMSSPAYPIADSDLNDLFIVKTHINLEDNPMSIKDYFDDGRYVGKEPANSIENILDEINHIATLKTIKPEKRYDCRKGPKCPFIEMCFPDASDPNSIFRLTNWNLYGGAWTKTKAFMERKIEYISDIPLTEIADRKKNGKISNCYTQVMYQKNLIDKKYQINMKELKDILLKDYLNDGIKWLVFFDFESFQHCVPLVNNSTPWKQIVSQYSMHILRNDYDLTKHDFESGRGGNTYHYEFIGNHDDDKYINPSLNLYITLKKQLEEVGIDPYAKDYKVIVFNKNFENTRLDEFAKDTKLYNDDKLREFVKNFRNNVVDLLDFFTSGAIYCRDFNGRGSLKVVQPTFAMDKDVLEFYNKILPFDFSESLDYHSGKHHLVYNGAICLDLYKSLLVRSHLNEEHTGIPTKDLLEEALAYCKIDSWGTVIIYDIIKNVYEGNLKLDCEIV